MILAIKRDDEPSIKRFLEAGYNPNERDQNWLGPIHYALYYGKLSHIPILPSSELFA